MEIRDYQIDWVNRFNDPNTRTVPLYGRRATGRTTFGIGMVLSTILSKFNSIGAVIAHNHNMKTHVYNMCLDFLYSIGLKDELTKVTKNEIVLSNGSKIIILDNNYISRLCGVRLDVVFVDNASPLDEDIELKCLLTSRLKTGGKFIISRDI